MSIESESISDSKMDADNTTHKMTMNFAEWPRDAPSALERYVITIICGNTRLHWALHEGCMNKFIPIVFWYTMHDSDNESNLEDEGSSCEILEAHIAGQAHALIFGETDKGTIERVSKTAARRDAPGISVYVVSSNPTQEQKICYMFKDVPAKIFKLRNTDFFTIDQGVYPTMGVDRCAALYGAKAHYGKPALVIDGGTAMTYTMCDADGVIQGGGISPGVKVRLQSLADYTGSLPTIDHKTFKTAVEGAMSTKTPLPFFAKDTKTAMVSLSIMCASDQVIRKEFVVAQLLGLFVNCKIAPVCAELSCQLRNIIKQFVSKCKSSPSSRTGTLAASSLPSLISTEGEETAENASKQIQRFPVVITGGDGKFLRDLLQADASGIIDVEPDASPVLEQSVEIRHVKNLVTYALGDVLFEKFMQKARNSPEEKLRVKIQGLRIAAPGIDQKELFSRGCVFNITPETMIEGYIFHARFDNGSRKDLTLSELYDSLVLYNEIGERPENNKSGALVMEDEDWVTEKKMWSKKVQEELGNASRMIRNRIRQLKPHIEKGELAEIFQRWSHVESVRRNEKTKRPKVNANRKDLVGKRIAKRFPVDVGGTTGDQIFFGTVKYISHNLLQWLFVCYDDGDSEDLTMDEVIGGINLYEVHKLNDPIHKDDVENFSSAIDVDGKQSQGQPLDYSKPIQANPLHSALEGDGATAYTDLSSLLGLSASSDAVTAPENYERQISEFKEDL